MLRINKETKLCFIVLTSLSLIASCSNVMPSTSTASDVITTKTPDQIYSPTATQTKVSTITPTSTSTLEAITLKCPDQVDLSDLGITGSVVKGIGSLAAIHIPDLINKSPLISKDSRTFYGSVISDNGLFIASQGEDDAGEQSEIDIFSSDGDLVNSFPESEKWTSIWGWNGDDTEVVLRTTDENILTIINPSSNTTRDLKLEMDKINITAYSPQLDKLAYYSTDQADNPVLTLWDVNKQAPIWSSDEVFTPLVSDIAWSNSGNLVAISTFSDSDYSATGKFHMEIMVVDGQGNHYLVSNFKDLLEEIQIVDLQWSPDDTHVYFWAQTNDKKKITESNYDLYDIEIKTGNITKYCFTGNSENNKLIWISDTPDTFIATNYTKYDLFNVIFNWDVVLVDNRNNKSAIVGSDYSPNGWIPDP